MMPKSRQTTAKQSYQSSRQWAYYSDLEAAAKDIILYMDALRYPVSAPSLFAWVQIMKQKKYFEEPFDLYYSRLEATRKRVEGEQA